MFRDRNFYWGIAFGLGGLWVYHHFMGLPGGKQQGG